MKIEVIQGGLGFDKHPMELPPILHETTDKTGIRHLNGTISMARLEPGTASSEIFICINDQPELDFGGTRNPDRSWTPLIKSGKKHSRNSGVFQARTPMNLLSLHEWRGVACSAAAGSAHARTHSASLG